MTRPSSLVPRISLICVGSELLRGKINTHASTLARRLAGIGLTLYEEQTVSDDLARLTRVIGKALLSRDVVLVTGGLGPTFDDVTREAASAAIGRRLQLSSSLLRGIQKKFRKARLRRMPPANARQAYLLQGAQAIPNAVGTAPGQWLEGQGPRRSLIILLPGPPSELVPMLDAYVMPRLKRGFARGAQAEAHLHFVNVPESEVDHKVRPVIARDKTADFTILAQPGLVDLDIFTTAATQKAADAHLSRLVRAVKQKTGRAFYGMNADYPLEQVILKGFLKSRQTLALAESCTGGALAKHLTDCAGSSGYFLGSLTTYSNASKSSFLGVPDALLKKAGAVSKEVALAMATGAREKFRSTWGLSITGIAGPGGGTAKKPIGLVYIALSGPKGRKAHVFRFAGNRSRIRFRAVIAALDLLRQIHLRSG